MLKILYLNYYLVQSVVKLVNVILLQCLLILPFLGNRCENWKVSVFN